MKKLLLALCLSPLGLMAQQVIVPLKNAGIDKPAKFNPALVQDKVINTSPIRINNENPVPHNRLFKYDPDATQIGATTYDLQTNNAVARRMILYPDGQVSVVWTSSQVTDASFTDRGTAYVHFDGSNWSSQNANRFENDRAGWPNIVTFNSGSTAKEMIVSHYASAGTGLSGGTFWMSNSKVGADDFTTLLTKDKPDGPLWPRVAATGNLIHVIAVYNSDFTGSSPVKKAGVFNPIVYYRYNMDSGKFEVQDVTLPGFDSTRYGQGSADEYSIDARDSIVAIVIGGSVNDVALWKSTDYGKNWTKTIIDTFAQAPFDIQKDNVFDTTSSNDGSVNVTIDKKGVAHVFYPRMRVINATQGDAQYSYFPGTNGIVYWNDKDKQKGVIAGTPDIDGDGTLNIKSGTTNTSAGGYSHALSTYPIASVDANNNIYLIYSAPNETDTTVDGTVNYRDVFVVYSKDEGQTWSSIQDITGDEAEQEDVFATCTRDANDKLHLSWMRDSDPGIFLINSISISLNQIMYAAVPVSDILNDKLGVFNVGIKEVQNNNVFQLGNAYPNPANDIISLPLSVMNATSANVKMVDMLGKVVSENNYSMLSAGNHTLSIDLSGLSKGVYFCQVNAGGYTTTQKVVVK